MCGITGYINLDGKPASGVILQKMTDAIEHRGPDGQGHFVDGNMAIGHRRLSIIDLSPAGHQPMMSPDGRYILSYNGEVYNFKEIRTQLEAIGHQFKSRTDSEVVLHAMIEWGEKALNKFNGMFAFALWDNVERTMFIARDRYGTKPLYYSHQNNVFLFGSEIKAILAHNDISSQMNKAGLLEYCTFQNFFTDNTLFEGVQIFPAGTYFKIKSGNTKMEKPQQYWDFHFQEPENPKSDQEYVEELEHLFRQAVTRQLVSDVDVGAFLSGGMDSGAITAVASSQLDYMRTFTCGFDLNSASGMELAFDEREKAEYMSYLFKTEHYEMVLKAGDMERCLPKLAWHLEEPRVGQSYPNYYAAHLTSKFNKVVLSGAGGDELFGGYPWRYYRAVVNDNFEDYIDKYYQFWQRLIPNKQIKQVLAPIWDDVKHISTRDIFRDVFKDHSDTLTSPEDYVNHSLYFEAKTFLHGLLVVDDKLTMAHGVESRVPFLDNDLVDFAMRVPTHLKLGNLKEVIAFDENTPTHKKNAYFNKTKDGKLILRKATSSFIPDEITSRAKQGFSAPDASWFRGESIDYVKSIIDSNNSRIYDFMDPKSVRNLVNEHLEGKQNRRLLIWSLLNIELCIKQFF